MNTEERFIGIWCSAKKHILQKFKWNEYNWKYHLSANLLSSKKNKKSNMEKEMILFLCTNTFFIDHLTEKITNAKERNMMLFQ